MPKIAEKAKALNGKGVVFSYVYEPQKFYFRELIPGTKRYRSRLIEGAETIEEALSGCIDAYTALRQTESLFPKGSEVVRKPGAPAASVPPVRARLKTWEVKRCVDEFLAAEKAKVEAGLLAQNTYENKQRTLRMHMLPYLLEKGCSHSQHIDTETFYDYPVWRKDAAKSTRKLELVVIKDFVDNFMRVKNLMRKEIDYRKLIPKIKITDSDLDANPPLDESNWRKILAALKRNCERAEKNPNHRGHYSNRLFYHWVIIARNSGLRPMVELNQLRWCDVESVNVGRESKSEGKRVDHWISVLYVKKSKTGRQRTVPANGVHKQLQDWKEYQKEYIEKYCPGVEVTDQTYVFGNPYHEMQPYSREYIGQSWTDMLKLMDEPLKPYVFSDRNYTLYSLRSTYICNLILQGKGIYDVAKLAGHTVAVCERYYARLDMAVKAKELTEFEFGKTGRRGNEVMPYI